MKDSCDGGSHFNEIEVLATLKRNGIVATEKSLSKCGGKGIKLLGLIDFLVNYCGYTKTAK